MLGSQSAARHMVEHGGGAIVNVTSGGGVDPRRRHVALPRGEGRRRPFHPVPRGRDRRARHARQRVAPANIATDLNAAFDKTAVTRLQPLPHGGEAGDVADAVRYLASDRAAHLTGVVLDIDGGMAVGTPPPRHVDGPAAPRRTHRPGGIRPMTMTERPGEWVDTAPGRPTSRSTSTRCRSATDRYTSREYADRERDASGCGPGSVRTGVRPARDGGLEGTPDLRPVVRHRPRQGRRAPRVRERVPPSRQQADCIGGRGNSNGPRIVCNYHLWSFNLDGSLTRVFRPELVGEVDIESLGLLPVSVDTFGGFVWMHPDPEAAPLSEYLGLRSMALLTPYRMHEMTKVLDVREAIECNWKVVIDAFTEGYHIEGIHPGAAADHRHRPHEEPLQLLRRPRGRVRARSRPPTREGFTVEDQIEGIRATARHVPWRRRDPPRLRGAVDESPRRQRHAGLPGGHHPAHPPAAGDPQDLHRQGPRRIAGSPTRR